MEMHFRFHVSKNQRNGWLRCVGQETPMRGTFLQDPVNQEVRESKFIYNGLQTPKHSHDAYDLYIPLLFWFNTDPAFAISNWNITLGKFWIEVDLETVENCVQVIDYAGDGGLFKRPSVEQFELITNHVYTLPEVAELFRHQSQFSLIRVHQRLERTLNQSVGRVNISGIRFAVESLYLRFRPFANDTGDNIAETWRHNDVSTYKEISYASIIKAAGITQLAYTPVYYYESSPAVDSILLSSDGNTIYGPTPNIFYSSYLPLRFGGEKIITPSDDGSYLMTFSIYPGKAQPSGYLNFSQSREQYLEYSSSYIDPNHPAHLVASATCINFLIRLPGAMSIRYAT
jgi:hypothetical protein